MEEVEYRKLQGMELEFVSGILQENPRERAIGYSVAFKASLDFLNFKQTANKYIENYLDSPINAIRPVLDGFAYHDGYNYFSDAAGKIDNSAALVKVFSSPDNYMDLWSGGGLERRFGKPVLTIVDGHLQITARVDFRWGDNTRQIVIGDLPIIRFQWALDLLLGHSASREKAPGTVASLGYAHEDYVEVEGLRMLRGTRYMIGKALEFGSISEKRIMTAG
ncbi:hypothetical protein [Pseudomonas sp. CLCA07]